MDATAAIDLAKKIVSKIIDWSPAILKGESMIDPFVQNIAAMIPGGSQAIVVVKDITNGLIAAAPAIESGLVSSEPYILAFSGLFSGSNATQETIDALLVQLEADSADFMTPLPPDDGSTTT